MLLFSSSRLFGKALRYGFCGVTGSIIRNWSLRKLQLRIAIMTEGLIDLEIIQRSCLNCSIYNQLNER
jgi:hypothetical protein